MACVIEDVQLALVDGRTHKVEKVESESYRSRGIVNDPNSQGGIPKASSLTD